LEASGEPIETQEYKLLDRLERRQDRVKYVVRDADEFTGLYVRRRGYVRCSGYVLEEGLLVLWRGYVNRRGYTRRRGWL